MKYLLQKNLQIYKLLKIKAENEDDAIYQAKLKTKSQSISCL